MKMKPMLGDETEAGIPGVSFAALSVVVGRNLDNLNLDMCMELLEQTPRGQRAAQLGPEARAPRSSATRQTMPRSAFERRPAEISLSEHIHPIIESAGRQP